MKKCIFMTLATLLVLSFTCDHGFAWGPATHTYIMRKLDRGFGIANSQKLYGAIAPDIFSYIYRVPNRRYLEEQMHYEFMGVWDEAEGKNEKAFALGFISHNDVWGADYVARHVPDYESMKAQQLIDRILKENPSHYSADVKGVLNALLALGYGHAEELCRIAVEYSVDLLIKRYNDPEIGARIALSSTLRDSSIPSLLAGVYGRDEDEKKVIIQGEAAFQKIMASYGKDLLQDEKSAIKAVAGHIAAIAPQALCIELPEKEKLVKIGVELINGGMAVCKSDYHQLVLASVKAIKEKISLGNFESNLDDPGNLESMEPAE
ncbi:MAG: hypothetical protein AB1611_16240 [bacterium]